MAEIQGQGGAVPPPEAKREVTVPGSEQATPELLAQAAHPPRFETEAERHAALNAILAQEAATRTPRPLDTRVFAAPDEPEAAVEPVPPAAIYQPAASNTDSPSRGIPRPIDDPGKAITGGFGDVGVAEYVPLDGTEALKVTLLCVDDLVKRLQDDLRFSIAVCYPRFAVEVAITVSGFVDDQNFVINRAIVPYEKTPLEVARARADEVVFCLVADRREMTADGQSKQPPNALRKEIQVPIPRKQRVETPQGPMLVDIVAE